MTLSGPSAAASTGLGPSAAATCLTFKTPPADSLYAGIPQTLFFRIYKIRSPSLCFEIFWGIEHNMNPTLPDCQVHAVSLFDLELSKKNRVFLGLTIV